MRSSDVNALVSRRNHPQVAAMQDWPLPYTTEAAERMVAALEAMEGPPDNDWWMATIASADDDVIHGDLALKFEWGGRAASVGYTLARDSWGQGYATEALTGLVDWLFDTCGVTRVGATLHPDNLRSAKVLERCGFDFEGHTRNSFWSDDENSDDWVYGLTPSIRSDWNNRPTHRPEKVELLEPHPRGLHRVLALEPHQSQKHLVSPIATSMAEVAVPPFEQNNDQLRMKPWPRVIVADDEPVGFVMLACPSKADPEPFLWRLTIGRRHQGRGIGWRVLELLVEQAHQWGSDSMLVSWVEGYGSPAPMYRRFGFEPTGEIDEGEIVGRLLLS